MLQSVRRAAHTRRAKLPHMLTDHRGLGVLVPEQFLDRTNVVAVQQQMGRKETPSEVVATLPGCSAMRIDGVAAAPVHVGVSPTLIVPGTEKLRTTGHKRTREKLPSQHLVPDTTYCSIDGACFSTAPLSLISRFSLCSAGTVAVPCCCTSRQRFLESAAVARALRAQATISSTQCRAKSSLLAADQDFNLCFL